VSAAPRAGGTFSECGTAYLDNGDSLQRPLADIGKGLIDVVVVYKVDRLTRSLADFAKMVERFEAR
jgi:site-specific DNA recombinase